LPWHWGPTHASENGSGRDLLQGGPQHWRRGQNRRDRRRWGQRWDWRHHRHHRQHHRRNHRHRRRPHRERQRWWRRKSRRGLDRADGQGCGRRRSRAERHRRRRRWSQRGTWENASRTGTRSERGRLLQSFIDVILDHGRGSDGGPVLLPDAEVAG